MAKTSLALLQGTLDVLVLKALTAGPVHGYGVALWLQQVTDETLLVEEGSLYPALHRLERRGWIQSTWGLSANNRRAKFYRLTPAGRARFREESSAWSSFAEAVSKVLAATALPSEAGAAGR